MRAAIYFRVSDRRADPGQPRAGVTRCGRAHGHEVVEVCRDHAVRAARAGTSARASRPCHKDAARRKVDVVMAWSVDRLGRSNLVAFLEHLRETLVFPASAGAGHHHLFAPRYVPMLRGLRGGTCLVSKAVCLGTCDRG
jgi:resolvase-like protein